MLIINVKDSDSIDKALKQYKKKVQQTRLINEIRGRKAFIKPSVKRRTEILKAAYRTKKKREMEG
ncbi:MAG: 30S ribosomal protein S21 [Chitinophagales bacterium]